VYTDDVKSFVENQRVNLNWEIRPNVLFRDVPDVENIELRFGIVLEIDTN
jgi:hypothetical protein